MKRRMLPISVLQLWAGPLPKEELFPDRKINPVLHWFIHPVKRHLAKYYLFLLKSFFGLKVVAVTGSSGKTTTSNLLYEVLSRDGKTVKTADSVTTTYNLPTTILRCTPNTRYLILEMGVEYRGDMDFYTWLAKPNIALLLNVSSVHSSFLGSTSDIFSEKSKLLLSLPANGMAVINADDPEINFSHNSQTLMFGSTPDCFTKIISAALTKDLQTRFTFKITGKNHSYVLPTIGTHLASNLAGVLTVFNILSVPEKHIISGLSKFRDPPHRLNIHRSKAGQIIIDDAYNANPLSTAASLKNFIDVCRITKKTPVFIFAQMNELGSYERSSHEEIGRLIKKLHIKHVFTLGKATALTIRTGGVGRYFDTFTDLQSAVQKFITTDHCVLIKGSNSWHLETLVPKLL